MNLDATQERYLPVGFCGLRVTFPTTDLLATKLKHKYLIFTY
jgi:hypothetical protein